MIKLNVRHTRLEVKDVVIPDTCVSTGSRAFYESTGIISFLDEAPGSKYTTTDILGKINSLTSCQLGSEGHPMETISNACFNGTTQNALTVTIFCEGEKVDTLVANIRNKATGATIIAKASESTGYGGESYAAGEIIITSEASL